jgi:hypothetical protein
MTIGANFFCFVFLPACNAHAWLEAWPSQVDHSSTQHVLALLKINKLYLWLVGGGPNGTTIGAILFFYFFFLPACDAHARLEAWPSQIDHSSTQHVLALLKMNILYLWLVGGGPNWMTIGANFFFFFFTCM